MTETQTLEADTTLTEEQTARAEALTVARAVLSDNHAQFVSRGDNLPKRFGTQDLIDLAQWILDGADPLAPYRDNRGDPKADPEEEVELPVPGSVQRNG